MNEMLIEFLGFPPQNLKLYKQAFTHRSYHNENPDVSPGHNERLEFLGDSVLSLSLSTFLMERFPEWSEGDLSRARAHWVSEKALADLTTILGFADYVHLGRGEEKSEGRSKPRLLASLFEAILGAAYLDGGYEKTHQLICRLFSELVSEEGDSLREIVDYKSLLQEQVQEHYKETPRYRLVQEAGPDHQKIFKSEVYTDTRVLGIGEGWTKKGSEQVAARYAMEQLWPSEEDSFESPDQFRPSDNSFV